MLKFIQIVFILLVILVPFGAISQPIIDGDLSDMDYTVIATKENNNAGFGANIDTREILYYSDPVNSKLYIGIKGELNVATSDGIGLFLGFTDLTGIAAGNDLGFSGAGHYMDGQGGGTDDNFKADFEVDYMFAMNPGSGSSSVFLDAAEVIGATGTDFIGTANQSGGTATDSDVFSTGGSATFAFNNGGSMDQGFEIVFDYSALGINEAMEMEVFAFVTSATGFFSDVTVPGDVTTGNLGFEPDFSTIPGGLFHNSTLAPLPVSLSAFNATPDQSKNEININWTTLSEKENDYFIVEKSIDQFDFHPIGQIHGAGDSYDKIIYHLTDDKPNQGWNYYRLKQVDFNGDQTYSNTISVEFEKAEISVFPNPTSGVVNVSFDKNNAATAIEIFNLQGQLIHSVSAVEENTQALSLAEFSNGVYFVRVIGDNGIQLLSETVVKR